MSLYVYTVSLICLLFINVEIFGKQYCCSKWPALKLYCRLMSKIFRHVLICVYSIVTKRQAIYLIARAFGKNIGFVRRGVRLLVAPWRASSSQVNTKCSGHNLVFLMFFWISLPSLHFHTWGWSLCLGGWADRRCHPRPREERPHGLGPTLVWLSCHDLLYLHGGKSIDPFKVTIQSGLRGVWVWDKA